MAPIAGAAEPTEALTAAPLTEVPIAAPVEAPAAFNETQRKVSESMHDIDEATTVAIDKSLAANAADSTWFECIGVEKKDRAWIETKKESCRRRKFPHYQTMQQPGSTQPIRFGPKRRRLVICLRLLRGQLRCGYFGLRCQGGGNACRTV